MDLDRHSLPQWAFLIAGLVAASVGATLINVVVLFPVGLPETFGVVTTIATMAPVLVYVGIWYDEDRHEYWDRSRERIVGDVLFVVAGASLGAAIALVVLIDVGLDRLLREIVSMFAGFLVAWGLFWWRNADLYRDR